MFSCHCFFGHCPLCPSLARTTTSAGPMDVFLSAMPTHVNERTGLLNRSRLSLVPAAVHLVPKLAVISVKTIRCHGCEDHTVVWEYDFRSGGRARGHPRPKMPFWGTFFLENLTFWESRVSDPKPLSRLGGVVRTSLSSRRGAHQTKILHFGQAIVCVVWGSPSNPVLGSQALTNRLVIPGSSIIYVVHVFSVIPSSPPKYRRCHAYYLVRVCVRVCFCFSVYYPAKPCRLMCLCILSQGVRRCPFGSQRNKLGCFFGSTPFKSSMPKGFAVPK